MKGWWLMSFPVLTNVVEIIVEGTVLESGGTTKNIFNVYHYFQNPTVPSPATAVAVANAFLTAVWAGVAAQLGTRYTGFQTLCRYLDLTTNPLLQANTPANGAPSTPSLPTQQAIVLPFRSATRGKNFRGSKHYTPVPSGNVTNDELNAGGVTAWTALLPSHVAQITAGGQTFSPCVVSRSLSQLRQDPVTIIGSTIVTALLNKTIGTMRRRKEKTVR
jgi:hypothetical protein